MTAVNVEGFPDEYDIDSTERSFKQRYYNHEDINASRGTREYTNSKVPLTYMKDKIKEEKKKEISPEINLIILRKNISYQPGSDVF